MVIYNPFIFVHCLFLYSICYLFYKIGKNKQSNGSTQCQSENQHNRQPGDPNITSVTVNQSYGKLTPAIPSFDEDPSQVIYEKM